VLVIETFLPARKAVEYDDDSFARTRIIYFRPALFLGYSPLLMQFPLLCSDIAGVQGDVCGSGEETLIMYDTGIERSRHD